MQSLSPYDKFVTTRSQEPRHLQNFEVAMLGIHTVSQDVLAASLCQFAGLGGGPVVSQDLLDPIVHAMRRGVVKIEDHILTRMSSWVVNLDSGFMSKKTTWTGNFFEVPYSTTGMSPESFDILNYVSRIFDFEVRGITEKGFGSPSFDELLSLKVFSEDWGMYYGEEMVTVKMDPIGYLHLDECDHNIKAFSATYTVSATESEVIAVTPHVPGHQVVRLTFGTEWGTFLGEMVAYFCDNVGKYVLRKSSSLLPYGSFVYRDEIYGPVCNVLLDDVPYICRPFDYVSPTVALLAELQCPEAKSLLLHTTTGVVEMDTRDFTREASVLGVSTRVYSTRSDLPSEDGRYFRYGRREGGVDLVSVPWDYRPDDPIWRAPRDEVRLNSGYYPDFPVRTSLVIHPYQNITDSNEAFYSVFDRPTPIAGMINRDVDNFTVADVIRVRSTLCGTFPSSLRAIRKLRKFFQLGYSSRVSRTKLGDRVRVASIRDVVNIFTSCGLCYDIGDIARNLTFLGIYVAFNNLYVTKRFNFSFPQAEYWPEGLFEKDEPGKLDAPSFLAPDRASHDYQMLAYLLSPLIYPGVDLDPDDVPMGLWSLCKDWYDGPRQALVPSVMMMLTEMSGVLYRCDPLDDICLVNEEDFHYEYPPFMHFSGRVLRDVLVTRARSDPWFTGLPPEMREEMVNEIEEVDLDDDENLNPSPKRLFRLSYQLIKWFYANDKPRLEKLRDLLTYSFPDFSIEVLDDKARANPGLLSTLAINMFPREDSDSDVPMVIPF